MSLLTSAVSATGPDDIAWEECNSAAATPTVGELRHALATTRGRHAATIDKRTLDCIGTPLSGGLRFRLLGPDQTCAKPSRMPTAVVPSRLPRAEFPKDHFDSRDKN